MRNPRPRTLKRKNQVYLLSKLFRGDPKLEAAAVSDPAHIMLGASGPHVYKIQTALNLLDGAGIDQDSKYGPATAGAVLAYKQKRNIVNRRYQTTADNIVGKMTIAALDAEMRGYETDDGRPPRIVAIYPTQDLSYRSSAVPHFRPVGRRDSERGAKTPAERIPWIVVPGLPPGVMELQVNHWGTFQVIDGVAGSVGCWDNSVGIVFDPAEPLAHGGTMWVTKSPQIFSVLARGIGRTFIEARKNRSWLGTSSFRLGDLVSLVVVAPSTKLTWKPQWTARKTSSMWCNPWASTAFKPALPEVPGVMLKSPWFEFTGTVDPDATVPLDDFELGILQAMLASK